MDFEKTSISTKIESFFQDNLKSEKDKESLQNVIKGKTLLKGDAINLLVTILQAIYSAKKAIKDFVKTLPV